MRKRQWPLGECGEPRETNSLSFDLLLALPTGGTQPGSEGCSPYRPVIQATEESEWWVVDLEEQMENIQQGSVPFSRQVQPWPGTPKEPDVNCISA